MENYVQLILSDGLHVRVNKEKVPESIVGSSFVHILTVIGTSERYYYRCVDEVLDDPANLKADIEEYLRTAPHLVAPFREKMGHDFIYRDEKIECRWSLKEFSDGMNLTIYKTGKLFRVMSGSGSILNSQLELEVSVKKAIDSEEVITDAEFEPEDLTTQFIRACQKEFGTNGEITTIIVNTKTKEITVTAQIEHKLYL